jgi:hypothetical protein
VVDKTQFVPGNTCAAASLKDQLEASASSGCACPRFWAFPGRFVPRSWCFVLVPGSLFWAFCFWIFCSWTLVLDVLAPGVLVLDVAGYWESWSLGSLTSLLTKVRVFSEVFRRKTEVSYFTSQSLNNY